MKKIIFIGFAFFIFALLNYSVYHKEQLKKHGETVLLPLTIVDPRSLMQGDYMRLNYDLGPKVPRTSLQDTKHPTYPRRGQIIVVVDTHHVAQFQRFYTGGPLMPREKVFRYKKNWGSIITVLPDSFMFQEGNAKFYQAAKYAVFKFNPNDPRDYILTGLADENRKILPWH